MSIDYAELARQAPRCTCEAAPGQPCVCPAVHAYAGECPPSIAMLEHLDTHGDDDEGGPYECCDTVGQEGAG